MGFPAARVGDMHVCPMVTPGVPPIPHVGGPILPPGTPTVFIGGMPAAVVGSMCTCVGPPDSIVKGSLGVFIGGMPAARVGDMTAHGGTIVMGCMTVLIGDIGGGSISAYFANINAIDVNDELTGNEKSDASAKLTGEGKPKDFPKKWKGEDMKLYNISNESFKKEILPALDKAESLVDEKIKQLKEWGDKEKECFKKAFGDHGKNLDAEKDKKLSQMEKMKELITDLKDKKEANFRFGKIYEEGTNIEKTNTFAWVNRKDTSHIVNLGEAYNSAPLEGKDSKVGTLIHELSHFDDIAGTIDHAYGLTEAKNLAKNNKSKAITNADNFEYYIEKSFGC